MQIQDHRLTLHYCRHASTDWACRHTYCRHASTGWACRYMYYRNVSTDWACRNMYCRHAATEWARRHVHCRPASTGLMFHRLAHIWPGRLWHQVHTLHTYHTHRHTILRLQQKSTDSLRKADRLTCRPTDHSVDAYPQASFTAADIHVTKTIIYCRQPMISL